LSRDTTPARGRAPAAALLTALALIGCAEEPEPATAPPKSAFADALGTVASGNLPVSTGFGWVDVSALRASRPTHEDLRSIAGALGPGGGDLLTERAAIERRTGVDPFDTEQLLSVAASFTTGVRLDGVRVGEVERALRATEPRGDRDGWRLFDTGATGTIPLGTKLAVFGALGARLAVREDSLILARTDQARSNLLEVGHPPLDDPAVRLALACLGEVRAARIVPNNFTHLPNTGAELLAFGVRGSSPATPREALCVVDASEEEIEAHAGAMREALAPDARDAVTGEPIAQLLADVEVATLQEGETFAARATLTPLGQGASGFLFGAFDRGSLLTYIGLAPPPGGETSP